MIDRCECLTPKLTCCFGAQRKNSQVQRLVGRDLPRYQLAGTTTFRWKILEVRQVIYDGQDRVLTLNV